MKTSAIEKVIQDHKEMFEKSYPVMAKVLAIESREQLSALVFRIAELEQQLHNVRNKTITEMCGHRPCNECIGDCVYGDKNKMQSIADRDGKNK